MTWEVREGHVLEVLQSRIAELEAEVERLKQQIADQSVLHKKLWRRTHSREGR